MVESLSVTNVFIKEFTHLFLLEQGSVYGISLDDQIWRNSQRTGQFEKSYSDPTGSIVVK